MQKLEINIKPIEGHENASVIHFSGDFDGSAKENLTEVQAFIDSAKENIGIILDFSNLNYLNSYAIGYLVEWHNHISQISGKIFIAGTNKNVEDIFAILGISNLFKVFPDVNTATMEL